MEISSGYLNKTHSPILDPSSPLIVGCCGTYRLSKNDHFITNRPNGRSDYQLLYLSSGKAHFYFHGTEQIVNAGSMVLFSPGQPQHYEYFGEETPQISWIHFSGYEVESLLSENKIPMDDPVFYTGTSSAFEHIFKDIISELQSHKTGFELLTSIYLRQMFILIQRARLHSAGEISTYLKEEIRLARDYFNAHYMDPICIEDYAQSRGISVSWFQRGFKKFMNQSPAHFLLTTRINNAAILLETTDHPIGTIAFMVGYEDPLYFSRLFRKYKGLSPSDYRKLFYSANN